MVGVNQVLTFTLQGVTKFVQGPFSVATERFDPTNHAISAVTLFGHPLCGWRFWRVFSLGSVGGTNDLVVETGGVDNGFPDATRIIGYYLGKADAIKMWKEDLQFILKDSGGSAR